MRWHRAVKCRLYSVAFMGRTPPASSDRSLGLSMHHIYMMSPYVFFCVVNNSPCPYSSSIVWTRGKQKPVENSDLSTQLRFLSASLNRGYSQTQPLVISHTKARDTTDTCFLKLGTPCNQPLRLLCVAALERDGCDL